MSKAALVALVAEKYGKPLGFSRSDAADILEGVLDAIGSSLESQGSFSLTGFGKWEVVTRGPRPGRNPNTGAPLKIGERKVVRFTPGEQLKRRVSSGDSDSK